MDTGLMDKNNVPIRIGNRVQITGYFGCVWEAEVCFQHGTVTVKLGTERQIQNPEKWEGLHDYICSRSWACEVGLSELETVARKSISKMGVNKYRINGDVLILDSVEVLNQQTFQN